MKRVPDMSQLKPETLRGPAPGHVVLGDGPPRGTMPRPGPSNSITGQVSRGVGNNAVGRARPTAPRNRRRAERPWADVMPEGVGKQGILANVEQIKAKSKLVEVAAGPHGAAQRESNDSLQVIRHQRDIISAQRDKFGSTWEALDRARRQTPAPLGARTPASSPSPAWPGSTPRIEGAMGKSTPQTQGHESGKSLQTTRRPRTARNPLRAPQSVREPAWAAPARGR